MKQRVMLFQTARQGLSRVLETAECGKLGLGVYGLMVTLATRTSLNVEWAARDNTGRPPITHHILRHRAGGGPYTTQTSPGSGTSASITGLAPGTDVRVGHKYSQRRRE